MGILPINSNPYIKAYTYHSYPLSILESERYTGEMKANIELTDSDLYRWDTDLNDAKVNHIQNEIKVTADYYADHTAVGIYREACCEDEITVKVNYIQYTQPYGYIKLFLSSEKPNLFSDMEEQQYGIGVYNKGEIFYGIGNNFKILKSTTNKQFGYFLRLVRKKEAVYYWFSYDGLSWDLILKDLVHIFTSQKYYIGLKLFLGENQYYNWLFTNYIQLYGRNVYATKYFVDYFVTPEKDGNFYTIHSLFHFVNMDRTVFVNSGMDIIKFIKCSIDNGKYIEFILNEYFLEGTLYYRKEIFNHANLVFGYDELGIYIMGYDRNGYIKSRRIDYSTFLKASNNNDNIITIFEFKPLDAYFKLNINTIKVALKEYVTGANSNLRFEHILPKGSRDKNSTITRLNEKNMDVLPELLNIYGIKIYDLFLDNEVMFEYMLKDVRIPYIFYEHKKIMRDRILFLKQKKHIKEADLEGIIKATEALFNKANAFLGKYLKYQKAPNDGDEAAIREQLKSLKEQEEHYYPMLIESLY